MIICKTPFRISLFGGSTDYEEYYSRYESLLLGFTMNQYGYVVLRETPTILPHKTKLSYSKTEFVEDHSKIKHNGIRGVLEFLDIKYGIEINYLSDLPAKTGIGSSSSFIVGLLNCFASLHGRTVNKKDLANDSIYVERVLLQEAGGIQDQIWAAYGGINSIHIKKDGRFEVKPLPVSESFTEELLSRSILIYTGNDRQSYKLAKQNKSNSDHKKKIQEYSHSAYESFLSEDVDEIARLLDSSWIEKRELSKNVSNVEVDALYNSLKLDGMLGGKLLGSGGSGFIFGILQSGYDISSFARKYGNNFVDFGISYKGSEIIND
jgi:D-glycero-alpha-D-manno-heptose-7-phosphate kinase